MTLALVAAGAPAVGPQDEPGPSDPGAKPAGAARERDGTATGVDVLREELEVFADRGGGVAPISIASTPVRPEESVAPAASVSDLAVLAPGVAESGQGGLFQVVSIRGSSRQRVLGLFAGVRVTSERRAGAALSFVDPILIKEVDVLRGPASTRYGSGALGGVIAVAPRTFDRLVAQIDWEDQGDLHAVGFGWGNDRWSLGLARRSASDTTNADGERRFDRFEQISASFSRRFGSDRVASRLLIVPTTGRDIGKPNVDFPERTTFYPRERHLIARYAFDYGADLSARAFVHPSDLETAVFEGGSELEPFGRERITRVENETFDLGLQLEQVLPMGGGLAGWLGIEWFGRRGVDSVERQRSGDEPFEVVARSLDGASSDEVALWTLFDRSFSRARFELGARGTWIKQSASAQPALATRGDREVGATSGFVGAGFELGRGFELRASVGTGFRVPSLTERYFVGTTGRGQVVGNPKLDPERAFESELALRWASTRVLAGLTLFHDRVDDYIERVDEGDRRTFRNVSRGTLRGVEVDGLARIGNRIRLDWSGQRIRGEDRGGRALADIPAAELGAGLVYQAEKYSAATRLRWRAAHDRVASGEVPTDEAWLAEVSYSRRLRRGLELTAWVENLFDESWRPSADEQGVTAVGRSFGLGVRFALAGR